MSRNLGNRGSAPEARLSRTDAASAGGLVPNGGRRDMISWLPAKTPPWRRNPGSSISPSRQVHLHQVGPLDPKAVPDCSAGSGRVIQPRYAPPVLEVWSALPTKADGVGLARRFVGMWPFDDGPRACSPAFSQRRPKAGLGRASAGSERACSPALAIRATGNYARQTATGE